MHIEKVLVEARAKQFVEYRRAYRSRVIARETERDRERERLIKEVGRVTLGAESMASRVYAN